MRNLSYILIIFFLLFGINFGQLTVKDQESTPNTLMKVNDEGNSGSILLPQLSSISSSTDNKLYNIGGTLNWNGNPLSTGGSSLWTQSSTNIYYNSGNVGIGTTSPAWEFEVANNTPGEGAESGVTANDAGGAIAAYSSTLSAPYTHFADRVSLWSHFETAAGLDLRADGSTSDIRLYTGGRAALNERMRITADGNVGISTQNPMALLGVGTNGNTNTAISASASEIGVQGKATGSNGKAIHGYASADYGKGVYGYASGNYGNGIYGQASGSDSYAGYFSGNLHATGILTAGTKSFKIDHPLDPENKNLLHSCVESADMMNIYNGNIKLDVNGEAIVELPEWFEALNMEFRYQITPIGTPGPNLFISEEVANNHFKIAGGTSGMKVSWQITGIRNDAFAKKNRIPVEVFKNDLERGKYLHPDAFGIPRTAGVDYDERMEDESARMTNE